MFNRYFRGPVSWNSSQWKTLKSYIHVPVKLNDKPCSLILGIVKIFHDVNVHKDALKKSDSTDSYLHLFTTKIMNVLIIVNILRARDADGILQSASEWHVFSSRLTSSKSTSFSWFPFVVTKSSILIPINSTLPSGVSSKYFNSSANWMANCVKKLKQTLTNLHEIYYFNLPEPHKHLSITDKKWSYFHD